MIFIKQQDCAAALTALAKKFPGVPSHPSVDPEEELQEVLEGFGVATDQDGNGDVCLERLDVDTSLEELRDVAVAFAVLLPFLEDN